MKNTILLNDLEYIYHKVFENGKFNNSSILVTGATGLVGSLIVKSILYANKSYNCNIRVLAMIRNMEKVKDIFEDFSQDSNLTFLTNSLLNPLEISGYVDFIVHTASITASKEMVENPTGVLTTAFESTKNLLEYVKRNPASKMLYISSMEYYGQIMDEYTNVTEDKLGYIDIKKPRSSYPESKRVCEMLCNAYVAQYGLDVCSARLAQTFGAGVSMSDNRVFAQFAKSVVRQENIILHTSGKSEGNYCYTADVVYAIFLLLSKGEKGQSYNVSCSHSSIINMAKMVAEKVAKNNIKVEVNIPDNLSALGYAPDVKLKLNSDKLRSLGWNPTIDLENMFKRMIDSWYEE